VPERTKPKTTRADAVKNELLDRVRSGAIQPRERLPSERALATELGVSRNVLREAIGSLAAMNVLEARPGSGVYVSELDTASMIEPLEFAVSLGPSHLRSVIQARQVIEPGIAALAAQFGTPEQIDGLYKLIERSRTLIDDSDAYLDVDMAIHDAIVQMAGNPILTRISDALRRLVRTAREITNTGPPMREGALAGHEAIFEAIAARDAERAARAMQDHIQFVEDHLFDYRLKPATTSASRAGG
jgi:GntR family transcriptional regulator, transcriptional repressor for pyruvate dehydrogenase complex